MLYLPNDDMFVNKFVYCEVPSKAQIFARTGQRAVAPNGAYTGESSAIFGKTPTQSAMEFIKQAESIPDSKLSDSSEPKKE